MQLNLKLLLGVTPDFGLCRSNLVKLDCTTNIERILVDLRRLDGFRPPAWPLPPPPTPSDEEEHVAVFATLGSSLASIDARGSYSSGRSQTQVDGSMRDMPFGVCWSIRLGTLAASRSLGL